MANKNQSPPRNATPASATPARKPAPEENPASARGKIRVLLIDDHPVLRRGLVQMINSQPDMTVVGEAEDAGKGFELVGTLSPNVAVVDISLKTGNGIELVKNVKARYPDMLMLVLSMYDESLYAERALRAGSKGYIMKEEASEQIIVAIRRVMAGEIFLSEAMKSKMIHQLATGNKAVISPIEQLTDRELQVFRLIGEGNSTRQIAAQLHLSVRTVEAYREYIKSKLNLKNATELVQHAFHWVHHEAAA